MNGDDIDAYKFLPWYVESTHSSNPGLVFEFKVIPETNRFLHLFVAYDAWIKGFFLSANVIHPRSFYKSEYKGTLLSCCAQNSNDSELIIFELIIYGTLTKKKLLCMHMFINSIFLLKIKF